MIYMCVSNTVVQVRIPCHDRSGVEGKGLALSVCFIVAVGGGGCGKLLLGYGFSPAGIVHRGVPYPG